MRRRSKKCRKTALRALGDAPSANKENSFSSIFCRKDVHNFRNKTSEPATRSCSLSKKTMKNTKKEEDRSIKKQMQCASNENNSSITLLFTSCKISSVAFFIPLNGYPCNHEKNDSSQKIIDWNNLLVYGCSSAAIFSHQPDQMNKIYYYKPTVLPDLRLKYRTTSESSTNSEDSFICFESNDDVYDHGDYKTLKCTRYSSSPKASSSFPSVFTESQSEEKVSRKNKRVRFVDNTELETVHLIIAWDYAYRAARISPWETMARDSRRFKLKIQSLKPILNPILSSEHRAKIWETRMRDAET